MRPHLAAEDVVLGDHLFEDMLKGGESEVRFLVYWYAALKECGIGRFVVEASGTELRHANSKAA